MSLVISRLCINRNVGFWRVHKIFKKHEYDISSVHIYPHRKFYLNSCLKTLEESKEQTEMLPNILQPINKSSSTALKIKKISKAMKAYLERAQAHNVFLDEKNTEFEIGKYHLANMMGLDNATMTQDDIDRAIEYLLPSGLYEPKARPLMKSPEVLFPREKAAQFDDSGRPFSTFFYTKKANFHQMMHDIVNKFQELDDFEDKMIRKGIAAPPEDYQLNLAGGAWITLEELSSMFLEDLVDIDYNFFTATLTRLAEHPYGFRQKDFIWKFRKDFVDVSKMKVIPELSYSEDGRPFTQASCKKIHAFADVTVWGNGSGKIKINGGDISFFYRIEDRNRIMLPLELSGMLGKVDLDVSLTGVGPSQMAGAVQHATALCLRSYVSEEILEKMRIAGLLTYDYRHFERKKPGQKGARAQFKWKKR